MNIDERLKENQMELQDLINKFNELETQKQEYLKEILRLEGAIRELTLMRDANGSNTEKSG
jgi:chaperonin cofactor prefoldin